MHLDRQLNNYALTEYQPPRSDILTSGGTYFDFLTSDNKVEIADIAHALANICRFGGHTRAFYSVAQHSVLVSHIVPRKDALWGLLHDAAEAYIGDVPRPLKDLLPDYRAIEKKVEAEIFAKLGLNGPKPASIKQADLVALATEQRDLMPAHDDVWQSIAGIKPLIFRITPQSPHIARQKFIERFVQITAEA